MATGCSTVTYHFRWWYDVTVFNDGTNDIIVNDFEISAKNIVHPRRIAAGVGGMTGSLDLGNYVGKPFQNIKMNWIVEKTGEKGEANVQLNLPEAFTRKTAYDIVFRIHPDEKKVEVFYYIYEYKGHIDKFYAIKNDGSPGSNLDLIPLKLKEACLKDQPKLKKEPNSSEPNTASPK